VAPGKPETPDVIPSLVCAECGAESPPEAEDWRGHLTDDGEAVMFCPKCAEQEFGAAQGG
jgi:hypothetical protein